MKTCSRCYITKPLIEFSLRKDSKDGYRGNCKKCENLTRKKWEDKNKKKINEKNKNWSINNPEKRKIIQDRYNNTEKRREQKKIWARKNRKKGYRWFNEKYKNDILFNLKIKFRRRIYMSLRSNNMKKTDKMINLLGCTFLELKTHIEKQFTKNMSWDLIMCGKIHLDHIIPLSTAKDEQELKKLCHYTNLQPMWGEENIRKSNKILEVQVSPK